MASQLPSNLQPTLLSILHHHHLLNHPFSHLPHQPSTQLIHHSTDPSFSSPSAPPHSPPYSSCSPDEDDHSLTPTLATRPSLPTPSHPKPPSSACSSYPPEHDSSSSESSSSASSLPSPSSSKILLLPRPALTLQHHLTKPLQPPSNFATVAPGLFRASFPGPDNFEFLARLGLRTILTLVQEQYPIELIQHYERQGIKLIQYGIPGNKEPFVHIPEDKIRLALRQVLDVRNHPMLIHCNKGKHRTGCLVGCLRKLQYWSSTAIFDEYRRYAFPKSRNMDQQFIELFDHSAVWEEIDPEFAPEWLDLST